MAIGWPAFRLARRSAAALACPVACKLVCALACTLAGGCTRPTQDVRIGYACLAPDGGGQDAAAPGGATPGLASVGRGLAPAGDAAGPIAAAADRAGPVSTAHDAAGRDAAADRDQARDAASDARSDGTARACAAYGPLRCVNFLHFKVTDGREERGSCVETREVIGGGIGDFCQLLDAQVGKALFPFPEGKTAWVEVRGLQVFPAANGCAETSSCKPREVFVGRSPSFVVGAAEPGVIDIPVTTCAPCIDQFWYRLPKGSTCRDVCKELSVRCQVNGGCLCEPVVQSQ